MLTKKFEISGLKLFRFQGSNVVDFEDKTFEILTDIIEISIKLFEMSTGMLKILTKIMKILTEMFEI